MTIREFREVFVREMSKVGFYESWHSGCDHYGPMLQGYHRKPKDGTMLGPLWTIEILRAGKDKITASVMGEASNDKDVPFEKRNDPSQYLPPNDDFVWQHNPGCVNGFFTEKTWEIGEDPAATARQIIAWFSRTPRGAFVADYLPWDFLA